MRLLILPSLCLAWTSDEDGALGGGGDQKIAGGGFFGLCSRGLCSGSFVGKVAERLGCGYFRFTRTG